MQKQIAAAAFSMAIAIALGALGAHALREVLSPQNLSSFKTAVTYQVWHSLAIILLCLSANVFLPLRKAKITSWLFFAGILLFSGSIYLLSLRSVLGIGDWIRFIGPVTPLGGLLFISGWVYFGVTLARKRPGRSDLQE